MPTVRRSNGSRKRAQLSRATILDAATKIAADGDQVTFRALGTALGADPTAVYRHFRDKDELVRAVFDRLLVGVLDQIDAEASWREQLRSLAELTWQACERHPSVGVEANVITTRGPGELASVERVLSQLERAGLGSEDVVRFYAVYSSHLLAVAAATAAYRLHTTADADWSSSWVELGPVDPARYPSVAAAAPRLAALRDEEIYLTGIDVILDAAEAAAAGGPRP